jgi:glycosyltransferase involved in cell wall biosynthesis
MKILFVATNNSVFEYPTNKIVGGVELVEQNQIKALRELGHEVTIAASEDSVCDVKLPVLSKSATNRYRITKVVEYISDNLQENYDRIFFNKSLSISDKLMKKVKPWAHKLRLIYHGGERTTFFITAPPILFTTKKLVAEGAKFACVFENAEQIWANLEDRLEDGRAFGKMVKRENMDWNIRRPGKVVTDFYEVNTVNDNYIPIDQLEEPSKYLFIGRPINAKGPVHTMQSLMKNDLLDKSEFYCTSPHFAWYDKEKAIADKLEALSPGKIKYDAPREEIMNSFKNAGLFLFPTAEESAGGIASFEAAAHGIPVLTTSVWSDRYLKPFGLFHKLENKTTKIFTPRIPEIKFLTLEERKRIATEIRQQYSWEKYRTQIDEFMQ